MTILRRAPIGAILCVLFAAPGCVDKEKCDEAIRVTRDALSKEQPDIARQWRDRAWKICNDSTLTGTLDKEILDKETWLKKRADELAAGLVKSAKQRMNTAQSVWRAFDKLEEKDRTLERLAAHQAKATKMSQGLPPEYGKQIDEYNAQQFAKRRTAVEAAAKK